MGDEALKRAVEGWCAGERAAHETRSPKDFGIANPASVARLRQSVEADIARADERGLSLVAIAPEQARQERGSNADRNAHDTER